MFGALLDETSERNALAIVINDCQRQRILRRLFNNFDQGVDTPGLHTVRLQVKAAPCKTLLPPDLFQCFANDTFWRDPMRRPKCLHIV